MGNRFPAPEGRAYYGYQEEGIRFLLDRPAALLADEMGVGKSIQLMGLVNADESIQKVLVIAPLSMVRTWIREAEGWLVRDFQKGVLTTKSKSLPTSRRVFCAVNYDIVSRIIPLLRSTQWDLFVLDESQQIKNPHSQRAKSCLAIPTRRTVFISGSPMPNRPRELWPMAWRMDPEGLGKDYDYFLRRYCDLRLREVHFKKKNGQTGRKLVWDDSGATHLDELGARFRPFMLRRLAKDVLDLPPLVEQRIWLEPTREADKLLGQEQEVWDRIASGREEPVLRQLERGDIFEDLAVLRHELGMAKVGASAEHIHMVMETADRALVFCHHLDVIAAMREELAALNPCVVTGQTSGPARQAAVDAFQNDPSRRIFLANILAGGVGLTLTKASAVFLVEIDWTPENMRQAIKRAHRIGRVGPVTAQYLLYENSLDERILALNDSKARIIKTVVDQPAEERERLYAEMFN